MATKLELLHNELNVRLLTRDDLLKRRATFDVNTESPKLYQDIVRALARLKREIEENEKAIVQAVHRQP
jgi:hypothetical protein